MHFVSDDIHHIFFFSLSFSILSLPSRSCRFSPPKSSLPKGSPLTHHYFTALPVVQQPCLTLSNLVLQDTRLNNNSPASVMFRSSPSPSSTPNSGKRYLIHTRCVSISTIYRLGKPRSPLKERKKEMDIPACVGRHECPSITNLQITKSSPTC